MDETERIIKEVDSCRPVELLSGDLAGQTVSVKGWVYRIRKTKERVFIVIRDSTGIVQALVERSQVSEDVWETANKLYIESSLILKGKLRKDERAPTGYEIDVESLIPVSIGEPFPIGKDQSVEFLLDYRHLWLRSQKLTKIMKVRHYVINYLQEYLQSEGFWNLSPPIIIKSACEGGAALFPVDYFGERAYLTQSSQLYGEAFIYSLEKIYVFAPSFRAEPSRTVRHLAEYWHLEPEAAWYDFEKNIKLQEGLVSYVCQKMVENHSELLKDIGRDPAQLKKVEPPFPRMSYDEMVDILQSKGLDFEWGQDPGADEEKILTKDLELPLIVHHYPSEVKAFYMREDPNRKGTVLTNDMLAPEGHGEIITGSERIWKMDELIEKMRRFGLDPDSEDYKWYVDLRRYGSVPHSGFGLGIERFLKWILNLDHIRDAIPFPRTINRVRP